MCHFVSTGAGIVHEQKHRIIPATLSCATVRSLQQCVQLVFFQIADWLASDFLRLDGLKLPTPVDMFWAVQANKTGQGSDGGKTLIARGDATAACFLHILKEGSR